MTDISNAIKRNVLGPVTIDSVQVENIDFSKAYEKAVEARMTAEVQVKTREQELSTEQVQAQIRVAQAQAEADAQLVQAKTLASNQNLVELTKAERWNGVLQSTVIPNGTLPFIDAAR